MNPQLTVPATNHPRRSGSCAPGGTAPRLWPLARGILLGATVLVAQAAAGARTPAVVQARPSAEAIVKPLRTEPTVALAITAGFRDWGPATLAGDTVIGSNMTGRGGVFAFDSATGKPRWSWRGDGSGGVSVSAPIVVQGDTAVVLLKTVYPNRVMGLAIATGKERWHVEVEVLREAQLAAADGLVFVQTRDGHLRAYEAETGKQAWAFSFGGEDGACGSRPVVADGVIYLVGGLEALSSVGPRAHDRVWAVDAKTGQELWRHRVDSSSCADHPVVVSRDGVFVTIDGDRKTYGLDRGTGRRRWTQTITRTTDLERDYAVRGLIQAADVLVGMTSLALVALDPANGRVVWEVPGRFRDQVPTLGAAGNVLYFEGSPAARPAASHTGTLHAIDLDTRELLWSFSRPTEEPNWPLGHVLPFDGGLWVDTHKTLLKLQ